MKDVKNEHLLNYIQSVLDGFSVGRLLKLKRDICHMQDGVIVPIYKCVTARGNYALLEFEDFLNDGIVARPESLMSQLGFINYTSVKPSQALAKGFIHRRSKLYFLYKLNPQSLQGSLFYKIKLSLSKLLS